MPPKRGYKQTPEHVARRMAAQRRPDPVTKVCGKCGEEKPAAEFRRRDDGRTLRSYCIVCDRAYNAEKSRRFWKAHPELAEKRHLDNRSVVLRLKYGLKLEDYDAMLEAQGGGCAICHATAPGRMTASGRPRDRYFAIDHDHVTGQVRGLLCDRCNRGIGLLRDDADTLESAAAYLRRFKGGHP